MSLNYENQSNVSLWMKSPAILLFVFIFPIYTEKKESHKMRNTQNINGIMIHLINYRLNSPIQIVKLKEHNLQFLLTLLKYYLYDPCE